jgi:hypothetical protein
MPGTGYNLRDVPPPLWRRVLHRAKRDGHEMRQVFLSLLRYYGDGKPIDLRSASEAETLQAERAAWLREHPEDGPQPEDPTRRRLGEGTRRRP